MNRKEGRPRKRGWVFALVLLVVLGLCVFAAYRDGTGFDALRRYLQYGNSEESATALSYEYDPAPENRFAMAGDCLVVLSKTSLEVLDGQGGKVWSANVQMEHPALSSGGGKVAAYDVGGTALFVLDETGEVYTRSPRETGAILSARLNNKGWLALTAEEKSYKGVVGVYDEVSYETGSPRFEFQSSRRFVADAWVSNDCTRLTAATLGQENSTFVTSMVVYHLHEQEPFASYDIPGGLVVAMGEGEQQVSVTEQELTFADQNGVLTAAYPFDGGYLRQFALEGEGFSAVLLGRYASGSVARLVSVDGSGAVRGSLELNEEVLDISAAGRYLAVLYASRLVVYTADLEVYAALNGTDHFSRVAMRQDGSAILLGSERGTLFLP